MNTIRPRLRAHTPLRLIPFLSPSYPSVIKHRNLLVPLTMIFIVPHNMAFSFKGAGVLKFIAVQSLFNVHNLQMLACVV